MAQIDWPDERCIICLRTPTGDDSTSVRTDAHVIPESVGGKLLAPFLCQRCNSGMGTIEGDLPRDVIVLGLVDELEGVLPEDLVNSEACRLLRRHRGVRAHRRSLRQARRADPGGVRDHP